MHRCTSQYSSQISRCFWKKYAYSCLSFWRCVFFATKVESSLGEGDGYIVGMRFYSTCLSCRPLKVPRSTRRICFPCGFDAKDLLSTLPWDREWLGDELKTASGAPRNARGLAGWQALFALQSPSSQWTIPDDVFWFWNGGFLIVVSDCQRVRQSEKNLGEVEAHCCGWKKSCITLDGWNPIPSGNLT